MKVIKEDERQKITLICGDNKKYIQRRIYNDKREIYKTLQKINHPNIPHIINVEFNYDTVITEEYIEGKSLSALMEENAVFTKRQIKSIVNQLVHAMSELHKVKIIHRDIKPDNIIMDKSGHIWLIDYDIARFYRDEIRKDTESMGTFGYAPIEQYGMLPTDFKTDVYAFGATLMQLLDYSGRKGSLYKIAEKCKRLDPSQRYENSKKLKNAIRFRFLKNPLLHISVVILAAGIGINVWNIYHEETEPVSNTETPQTTSAPLPSTEPTPTPQATSEVTAVTPAPQDTPEATDDSDFSGFEEYPKYTEYKEYPTFAHALIFSTDEPWEHLLFIDDVNMNGKVKLGKKNTLVNADITLNDGVLSVDLDDGYGNTFKHKFKYENQYSYKKSNTNNLRKNADIICHDLDYDDVPELLIGLNEGSMGVAGRQFYNPFNYCIGWCLKYDENTGFTLCEGDMFSEGQAFTLTRYTNQLIVPWEDIGDVMGYELDGNKIKPI